MIHHNILVLQWSFLRLILQMYTPKAVIAMTASASAMNQPLNHLLESLKASILLFLLQFADLKNLFLTSIGSMLY